MRSLGKWIIALVVVCPLAAAQERERPAVSLRGHPQAREIEKVEERGTLHDGFQHVRGDSGNWSDEPRLALAPPISLKPDKTKLDDWLDQLLENPHKTSAASEDSWLLARTRQLDDNDRVWVERIERTGRQFTVVLEEAIWQGKYFKTFTYYDVFGINLGKLEPGQYEVRLLIQPRAFKQFNGDGRPASYINNRQIDNWPKDDAPAERKAVELRTTFQVVAAAAPGDRQSSANIDARIDAGLAAAAIPPSAASSDAEFIRRVHLDLHGVVPTAGRVRTFLDDRAADKRAKLIDELLAEPRFAAHLADIWDDYLIPSPENPRSSKDLLSAWLREAFETKSWDRIAHDLLTVTGQREKDPAVVYLLKGRETLTPAELTDLVSQYFLGMRLNCAQCHDHPFTSWKQSDYWGLAAFFTQIQYTDRKQLKSSEIRDDPAVDVSKLENADKLTAPRFLLGEPLKPQPGVPHRQALADWIVSPENPYFARAMVNRMWWQLMGRGLVEPVDDMHQDQPATHPELLAELAQQFAAAGFDLRHLCRAICNSAAYQRTSIPTLENEQDSALYSHMAVKVLTPEQLYDSLLVVAPVGLERRKPFVGGSDPRGEFVQFFRSDGDPNPTAYDRGIPQTLRMMNAPQLFAPRIESAAVRRIIEAGASDEKAIDTLYLHVLARAPTDDERKILDGYLARHPGPRDQAHAEILWGLVNSSEFSLNH